MKSLNALRKNTQLVTYAFVRWKSGEVPLDRPLWLRHNYYIREKSTGKLSTEKREVQITYADALRFVNERVIPVAKRLVEIKLLAQDYKEIPMPTSIATSCQKYGGCDYLEICSGRSTPDIYKEKVKKLLAYAEAAVKLNTKDKGNDADNKNKVGGSMGLLEKIKKQKEMANKAKAPAQASAPKAKVEKETKKEVKKETKKDAKKGSSQLLAPWATDEDCTYCSSSPVKGVKAGKVCPVCRARGKAKLKIDAGDYILEDVEGTILIMTGEGDVVIEYVPEEPVVESKEKSESIAEKEIREVEEAAAVETKPEPEPEPEPEPKPEPKPKAKSLPLEKGGTPEFEKKGLLLIGCSYASGKRIVKTPLGKPNCIMSIFELFEQVKVLLMGSDEVLTLKKSNDITFWEDLPPFDRRDLVRAYGAVIAQMVGQSTIMVPYIEKGSDVVALLSAIYPYMVVIQSNSVI
jgi:hypothetical protein